MKEKNGFTLIELLAIIVILAIIAVITVPIILNIIENSRKGAATDSAYGYKDSINKYYVTELANNRQLQLEGPYTVTNGVLNGSGISNKEIPVSGDKPSAGELHYTNNTLQGGCLVIGDFKITFKSDGSVDKTEKGDCSDYTFPTQESPMPTMAEMCPDCVFAFTLPHKWYYSGTPTTLTSNQYKENYEDIISETGNTFFLGLKLNNTSGTIEKAYACGFSNDKVFCLEGTTNGSSYEKNVEIIKAYFPGCKNFSKYNFACSGDNNEEASAYPSGAVYVNGSDAGGYLGTCSVYENGKLECNGL